MFNPTKIDVLIMFGISIIIGFTIYAFTPDISIESGVAKILKWLNQKDLSFLIITSIVFIILTIIHLIVECLKHLINLYLESRGAQANQS